MEWSPIKIPQECPDRSALFAYPDGRCSGGGRHKRPSASTFRHSIRQLFHQCRGECGPNRRGADSVGQQMNIRAPQPKRFAAPQHYAMTPWSTRSSARRTRTARWAGRVSRHKTDLGVAQPAVAELEARLRPAPFRAPEAYDLEAFASRRPRAGGHRTRRTGAQTARRCGALPTAPTLAMRAVAALDQPFTTSQARPDSGNDSARCHSARGAG